MIWTTVIALVVAPLLAPLLYLPGHLVTRWVWKRMPEGRFKRFLLKDRGGGFIDYPEGVKRWDE